MATIVLRRLSASASSGLRKHQFVSASSLAFTHDLTAHSSSISEIVDVRKSKASVGGVRGFHSGLGVLNFRASEVSRAQALAYDVAGNESSLEIARLGIAKEIVTALAGKGITKLFPIQRAVLEPAMQGRDMIARAKTGTGKTLLLSVSHVGQDQSVQCQARARKVPAGHCVGAD